MKILIKHADTIETLEPPVYEINNTFKAMVDKATSEDQRYQDIFVNNYQNKMTYFSPYVAFCLNELNFDIYIHDPLMTNRNEVLFATNGRFYIASYDFVNRIGFNKKLINNYSKGFQIPTDEVIHFDETVDATKFENGIITDKGYLSSDFISNFSEFLQIVLCNMVIQDEASYRDYLENAINYKDIIDYFLNGKKITITHLNEDKLDTYYNSDAFGKPMEAVMDLEVLNKSSHISGRNVA